MTLLSQEISINPYRVNQHKYRAVNLDSLMP